MRKIPPATTLVWYTAFYIGLGWQWIAKTNPTFGEEENPLEPFNVFLKFFLSSFVFICIGTAQYLVYEISTMFKQTSPSLEFVDLCLFANCSVLVLTEPFSGHYIHGKAPWGSSDLPLAWLSQALGDEAAGRLPPRGFGVREAEAKKSVADPITFDIFIHKNMRADYDKLWKAQVEEEMSKEKKAKAEAAKAAKKGKGKKGAAGAHVAAENEAEDRISRVEAKKRRLNKMLCEKVEEVNSKGPDNVVVRSICERLTQSAPARFNVDEAEPEVPFVVVRDTHERAPAFEHFLYCCLDVDLVQFMALWWFFFEEYVTGDPMQAVALTYLVEAAFKRLRAILGENNLVKKTFTDGAFLN